MLCLTAVNEDSGKVSPKQLTYVTEFLSGKKVQFIVDTGSHENIISSNVLKEVDPSAVINPSYGN